MSSDDHDSDHDKVEPNAKDIEIIITSSTFSPISFSQASDSTAL